LTTCSLITCSLTHALLTRMPADRCGDPDDASTQVASPTLDFVANGDGRPTRPAAVLWDLDGTMLDSEKIWWEVEQALFAENGGVWTEEFARALTGSDLYDSAVAMIEAFGWSDLEPHALVTDMVRRVELRLLERVEFLPGVERLLAEIQAAGIPMAIVTASYKPLVDALLTQTDVHFSALVTGELVSRGKPDPEPYLTAAELLGVDPADCVAIEDSVPGAASASSAGCHVLIVPHAVVPPAGERRTFADSLEDVDLAKLSSLVAVPAGS
jgi:HAD superfamily hydrolase (TIGR01509 family)